MHLHGISKKWKRQKRCVKEDGQGMAIPIHPRDLEKEQKNLNRKKIRKGRSRKGGEEESVEQMMNRWEDEKQEKRGTELGW